MPKLPPAAHRWTKGKSGNPSGKPKDFPALRELARSHAPDAIETLVKIMTGRYPASARVQAATAILERGYGKPQQYVEADLRIDAVRVTAGRDFDAKVLEAVAKLGRNPDGTAIAAQDPLELPAVEHDASDDEVEDLDLPNFRAMMHDLQSGRSPAACKSSDRLDGYRDASDPHEPS